jgi:glutamate-1-semialdehyde 2,1-aminomutase
MNYSLGMAAQTAPPPASRAIALALDREERRFRRDRSGSARLSRRAGRSLAGGVASSFQRGDPWPLSLTHGDGPAVWDVDGHRLLDFHNGFGAMVQGHAHPAITRAVAARAAQGTHPAAPGEDAIVVADELARRFRLPLWRFTGSGSEATMDAIRIARAFTGRDVVIKALGGYHGHHDAVLVGVDGEGPYGAGISPPPSRSTTRARSRTASWRSRAVARRPRASCSSRR